MERGLRESLAVYSWRLVRKEGLSSLFATGKSDTEILCEVAVLMVFKKKVENLTVKKEKKITV